MGREEERRIYCFSSGYVLGVADCGVTMICFVREHAFLSDTTEISLTRAVAPSAYKDFLSAYT